MKKKHKRTDDSIEDLRTDLGVGFHQRRTASNRNDFFSTPSTKLGVNLRNNGVMTWPSSGFEYIPIVRRTIRIRWRSVCLYSISNIAVLGLTFISILSGILSACIHRIYSVRYLTLPS